MAVSIISFPRFDEIVLRFDFFETLLVPCHTFALQLSLHCHASSQCLEKKKKRNSIGKWCIF